MKICMNHLFTFSLVSPGLSEFLLMTWLMQVSQVSWVQFFCCRSSADGFVSLTDEQISEHDLFYTLMITWKQLRYKIDLFILSQQVKFPMVFIEAYLCHFLTERVNLNMAEMNVPVFIQL